MANTLPAPLSRLRTTALVIIVSVLIQLGLGIAMLSGSWSLADAHGGFGYLTFIASLVAAVFAFQASKADPTAKGLLFHTLSLPVLALVQIGMVEAGGGSEVIKWVHVVLGLAFIGAVVSLFSLLNKRTGASRI